MRLVRIGRRWIVNLDAASLRTGLEGTFILKGNEAELFLQALEQFIEPAPSIPIKIGQPHPHGPGRIRR